MSEGVNIDLVKTRRDMFVVEGSNCRFLEDSINWVVRPYTVDALDKEKTAFQLVTAGRDYIKKGLCLLCPDFVNIFNQWPADTAPKKENRLLLELLEEHINNIEAYIDFDFLCELRANELYEECLKLENTVKVCKRFNLVELEEKQKELETLSNRDIEQEIKDYTAGVIEAVRREYLDLVNSIKPFCQPGLSNTMRRTETQNRDLFFIMILQGLCFFYDYYSPSSIFNKFNYSVLDILAVYSTLKDTEDNKKWFPFSVNGLYGCFDAFMFGFGVFGKLKELKAQEDFNIKELKNYDINTNPEALSLLGFN